jgi:uncharacterized membrane protein
VVIVAVVLAVAAIGLAVVGFLGWTGRLPRNQWTGIRTKTTMSSDKVWQVAHHKAGPWLTISGAVMLVGAVVSVFADAAPRLGIAGGVIVVLAIFGVAGGVMTAADAARKALREQLGEQSRPHR